MSFTPIIPGQHNNGWAIDLLEDMHDGKFRSRVVQFFPERNVTDESSRYVANELTYNALKYPFWCSRWDGRIVYNFPVPKKEYAREVCRFLYAIRKNSYLRLG